MDYENNKGRMKMKQYPTKQTNRNIQACHRTPFRSKAEFIPYFASLEKVNRREKAHSKIRPSIPKMFVYGSKKCNIYNIMCKQKKRYTIKGRIHGHVSGDASKMGPQQS